MYETLRSRLHFSVLSLYPLVKLQKQQEKGAKWLSFAPFQSEFDSVFYLLLLLSACFLFHHWQLRHTQTRCLARVSWERSQPQFKRWSRARMKKCDCCHYVWRLAWRGLALSPVWDAPPVPKWASHKCEREWRGGLSGCGGESKQLWGDENLPAQRQNKQRASRPPINHCCVTGAIGSGAVQLNPSWQWGACARASNCNPLKVLPLSRWIAS